MGLRESLGEWFARLFKGRGHGLEELARRLDVPAAELLAVQPSYRSFTLPKRSGGARLILAPDEPLKALQRRLLRRLLARLRCHPAATGFERGRSIVTNALPHAGQAVVVRLDLKDFFASTSARRVYRYFRGIGWNRPASRLLTRLCTFNGGLPQGAPTSPRLSNLVNYRLDTRLAALASMARHEGTRFRVLYNPRTARRVTTETPLPIGTYSRYADDITFSFAEDNSLAIRDIIARAKLILRSEGYRSHRRKQRIYRRHARQLVTGLVVNERINLPRATRRWLRAVAHRLSTGQHASLTREQLAGWRAFQDMVQRGMD